MPLVHSGNDRPRESLRVARRFPRASLPLFALALLSEGAARAAENDPAQPSLCNGGVLCESDREPAFTAGAEVDVASRSLWRGLAVSNGPVLEPTVWASAYHLQATVWSTLLLTDEPPHRTVRAVVPSIEYTLKWDRFKLEPGALYYWVGDELRPHSTIEIFANGRVTWGNFGLAVENYVDVKDNPGGYFGAFGPEYEVSLGRWTFKGRADVGWGTSAFNRAYYGDDSAAIDVAEAGGEVRLDLTDNFYLTVHSEGSVLLASNLRRNTDEPELVAVGASFGAEL